MAEEQNNSIPASTEAQPQASGSAPAQAGNRDPRNNPNRRRNEGPRPGGDRRGGSRGPRRGEPKAKPEFDQKIIDIRRVTRVVSGGRRFSFSVALVVGNRKGSVGVGIGKAGDTALAIEKALKDAKKNLVKVPVNKNMSIPYEVKAKYSASHVTITPNPGRGIVAGSSVRSIIELAGLKDVGAKLHSGSKNRLNNARVTLKALSSLTPHRRVIMSRRAAALNPVAAK